MLSADIHHRGWEGARSGSRILPVQPREFRSQVSATVGYVRQMGGENPWTTMLTPDA